MRPPRSTRPTAVVTEDWHAIVARYARPVRWRSLWQLASSLALYAARAGASIWSSCGWVNAGSATPPLSWAKPPTGNARVNASKHARARINIVFFIVSSFFSYTQL